LNFPKSSGTQVLQVRLELLRVERLRLGALARGGRRRRGRRGVELPRLHVLLGLVVVLARRQREQRLLREDRRLEAERDGDRVRRTRVDLDHALRPADVQLGVVRPLLDLGDLHAAQRTAEAKDERLAEVVRERALALDVVHLHDDGLRLGLPDPDREHAGAALLLQDDHVRVRGAVEAESLNDHFDHRDGSGEVRGEGAAGGDASGKAPRDASPHNVPAGTAGVPADRARGAVRRRSAHAARSASAMSVRSQVKRVASCVPGVPPSLRWKLNASGVRPKCPYAAVAE
jgi:hypothetical protein